MGDWGLIAPNQIRAFGFNLAGIFHRPAGTSGEAQLANACEITLNQYELILKVIKYIGALSMAGVQQGGRAGYERPCA